MIVRSLQLALVALVLAACAAAPVAAPPAIAVSGTPLQPAAAPGVATWAPWPSALHDARHSGAATVDGPTTGAIRWRRTFESGVTTGAVVGPDGTIYVAPDGGALHALDPATGADRWVYDGGRGGGGDLSTSPLVLPDGTVLWGVAGGELVALSPAGALLWAVELGGRPTSPVSADGRRVYVGDTSGGVTAIDVASHRVVWRVAAGSSSYGSVVTDGEGRIYTTAGSALVAIDDRGASATVAWQADPHDDITEVSAGLAADGTALLGTNGRREWAYRPDGTPLWNAPRVITYSSPAVTADGLAYVADHSGRIRVLDVTGGAERAAYQLDPPQQIWSSVAIDRAHRVYFGTLDGRILGLGPDLEVLFDVPVGASVWAYPAITGDGAVVFGVQTGELIAVG